MQETYNFTVKYEAGHSYQETWELTDLFCPQCGSKTIWHEVSPGDYYVGEQHLCLSCHVTFTIQGPSQCNGWQNRQRLDALPRMEGV
jgi:hypothetical protein